MIILSYWAYLDFKINIYLVRKTMKEEISKILSNWSFLDRSELTISNISDYFRKFKRRRNT